MLPALTLEDFDTRFRDRHLIHNVVEKWSRETPDAIALIDADRDQKVTWKTFDASSSAIARALLDLGFRKGDCFATVLPLTSEQLFLEYACFKIGVVFVPLDLRLGPEELIRNLEQIKASGLAFLKSPAIPDPDELVRRTQHLTLKTIIQFAPQPECAPGVTSIAAFLERSFQAAPSAEAFEIIAENDPALVIFTTGSTGSPKPALLSHRNISCQAMCINTLLAGQKELITLVNLPPSHVGCQTELLMGTLFSGGTAVLLPVFDPLNSMRAIEKFRVSAIGQIPAMFQFEWRLKDYATFDLSSLEFVAYGGQQVSLDFIDRMSTMATSVETGLGLTETAGFCTYIRRDRAQARECFTSLGKSMPVYPMTIRAAMRHDGSSGEELRSGEVGHVCFRGPQTFLGYLNDPVATAATISSDGYLYTGDLGYQDEQGLHLSGRAKQVIKPAGYQVFPGDVENHFSQLPEVASCAVVGVEHPVLSEAIVAFVEAKPGAELTDQMLDRHARGLASYMRPRLFVLLNAGEIPVNRVAKADYLKLRDRAQQQVEQLKQKGMWS